MSICTYVFVCLFVPNIHSNNEKKTSFYKLTRRTVSASGDDHDHDFDDHNDNDVGGNDVDVSSSSRGTGRADNL